VARRGRDRRLTSHPSPRMRDWLAGARKPFTHPAAAPIPVPGWSAAPAPRGAAAARRGAAESSRGEPGRQRRGQPFLAPGCRAREPAQLGGQRAAAPLRLVLEGPEPGGLAERAHSGQHHLGAEAADQLLLQVGAAGEEAGARQRLRVLDRHASPGERALHEPGLRRVEEPGGAAEVLWRERTERALDVGDPVHHHDPHAAQSSGGRQPFDDHGVAASLDEDDHLVVRWRGWIHPAIPAHRASSRTTGPLPGGSGRRPAG
jgi:hypothetical protein